MNTRLIISIRQALSQVGRNLAMTVASLFSITAILLILGLFFIIVVNISHMSEEVKENFDSVQINLEETTDRAMADDLIREFEAMPEVSAVVYQTKDENLAKWKVKWGDNKDILDRLPTNPLPNSIIVTLGRVEDADTVVARAEAMRGIERITYSQDTVNKLIAITNGIQLVGLVLIGFLLIISIVVVSNTVKLTVLAREREINIMKYVGATNWFIRGPFLMEGIIIGIIGAAISSGIISGIYHYLVTNFGVDIMLVMQTGLVSESHFLTNLGIIFVALGISIGACGSIISMRRFLDT
jgi:cell division transport system permease protein